MTAILLSLFLSVASASIGEVSNPGGSTSLTSDAQYGSPASSVTAGVVYTNNIRGLNANGIHVSSPTTDTSSHTFTAGIGGKANVGGLSTIGTVTHQSSTTHNAGVRFKAAIRMPEGVISTVGDGDYSWVYTDGAQTYWYAPPSGRIQFRNSASGIGLWFAGTAKSFALGDVTDAACSTCAVHVNGGLSVTGTAEANALIVGGGGSAIATIRKTASSSIDLGGSTTANCTAETNVSITGVAAGDSCTVNTPAALASTDWIVCRTLTDNVALKYCTQGTAVDPAAMVYTITTIEY